MRAYGKLTGDYALQERVDVQTGLKMILNLCLSDGFDMFPSLLVTDGSCMIDRRMGIHGHPLEIQVSSICLIVSKLLRIERNRISVNYMKEMDAFSILLHIVQIHNIVFCNFSIGDPISYVTC